MTLEMDKMDEGLLRDLLEGLKEGQRIKDARGHFTKMADIAFEDMPYDKLKSQARFVAEGWDAAHSTALFYMNSYYASTKRNRNYLVRIHALEAEIERLKKAEVK